MSITIKTGWLNDKQGNKFAPKTLMSQVQTGDGILLEDKIKADLDNAVENISVNTLANAKDYTDAEITEWVGDKTVSEQISAAIANKSDVGHDHDEDYDTKGSASAVQANLDVVSDELDEHASDTSVHVTTSNKSNWNTAYTHSQSTHARTDATKVADSTTNGNILINGSETNVYTHPTSGITAGAYKSVTVNEYGHVIAGTNPTTLSGYGITDAYTDTEVDTAIDNAIATITAIPDADIIALFS